MILVVNHLHHQHLSSHVQVLKRHLRRVIWLDLLQIYMYHNNDSKELKWDQLYWKEDICLHSPIIMRTVFVLKLFRRLIDTLQNLKFSLQCSEFNRNVFINSFSSNLGKKKSYSLGFQHIRLITPSSSSKPWHIQR
jgi:hypothetical protein